MQLRERRAARLDGPQRQWSFVDMNEPTNWYLDDPRPIAASSPYTFFMPSETECLAVRPGDVVKLIFAYEGPTEKWAAERMWVLVSDVRRDGLAGTLDNDPDEPNAPLKSGDVIAFLHHHIIGIEFDKPDTAPPPVPRREYWQRCFVEECVLDGSEPVELLYREAPLPPEEGETYQDSGWRIRGRRGTATDADYSARQFSYVALGAVLNEDDSWLPLIDMPVDSEFERNFASGNYIRCA
jgi:hypothetical protein